MTPKSWQLGNPRSLVYHTYDWLRTALNRRLAAYLQRQVAALGDVRTLEAGSGPGRCSSFLRDFPNVSTATIVDIDAEVLAIARARDPRLQVVAGDCCRLPLPDNAYHLVFSSSTIEHLEHPVQAVREMVRVCRPEGFVFIGMPMAAGPLGCFLICSATGSIRQWVGRFIERAEVLSWSARLPLALVAEPVYFFRFFQGYLWRKLPLHPAVHQA